MTGITFEEIMFTIMSATQDTFKNYLGVDIFAGKVERKVDPVDSDVVGIVGIAGDRVDLHHPGGRQHRGSHHCQGTFDDRRAGRGIDS